VASVIKGTFARVVGTSGLVKITAPFPDTDSIEGFTRLVAITLARMLAPQGRLNGVVCRVAIGMMQEAEDII